MTLSSIFEQVAGKPVEDRTYNIGEISQKTGLMKTANGWVEPSKRNHGTVQKKRGPGAIYTGGNGSVGMDKMKEAAEKGLKGQELKEFMIGKKTEKASSEGPKMTPEQRKKWEDKAANPSETTASLRNQIKAFEKDPVTNPRSDEIIDIYKKELAKRESTPNYRPEKLYDSAPRALTGDCKVRIRK